MEFAIIEYALTEARIKYQPEEIGNVEMDLDRISFTLASRSCAYLIRLWDMSEEDGVMKIDYTLYQDNANGGATPLDGGVFCAGK